MLSDPDEQPGEAGAPDEHGRLVELFRLPHFSRFLAARSIASVAIWMERLATGWLAWELTHSTAWLGLMAFLRLMPALVFGLIGGAWADRASPMRVLRIANVGIVLSNVAMLALLLTDMLTILWLSAVALGVGALQALSNPAAGAFVYELVPRRMVGLAISINALTFHMATFVGPALAGFLIAGAGASIVYAVVALGQAVLLAVLLTIPARPKPDMPDRTRPATSLFGDVLDAIRYVRAERPVFALLFVHFVFALSAHPLTDMMPAIAGVFFAGGAAQVGALTAALGAGAILGGLWLAGFGRHVSLRRTLAVSLAALFPLIVFLALNRSLLLAYALLAAIGACLIVRTAGLQTLLQLTVADEMRGRAMGFYLLLIRSGTGIGAVLIGLASEWIGLSLAMSAAAAAGGAVILAFSVKNREVWRRIRVR